MASNVPPSFRASRGKTPTEESNVFFPYIHFPLYGGTLRPRLELCKTSRFLALKLPDTV